MSGRDGEERRRERKDSSDGGRSFPFMEEGFRGGEGGGNFYISPGEREELLKGGWGKDLL